MFFGHGTYIYLNSILEKIYKNNQKNFEIISADEFIYEIEEPNSLMQIEANKLAAERGLEILEEAFSKIKEGMTEKQIASLVHTIFEKKPEYFEKQGIIKEEYSWEKENCPIVLIGENLTSRWSFISKR